MPEPNDEDVERAEREEFTKLAYLIAELRAEKESAVKESEARVYAEVLGFARKRKETFGVLKFSWRWACEQIEEDIQKAADKAKKN